MQVSVVNDPTSWERWEEAKALLEPARARGNFPDVIEPDEALFVAMDGDELLAAATCWMSTEGYVEVKLVGGRDYPRWLAELNEAIGAAARGAGATRLTAIGRRGWTKILSRLGWVKCQPVEDHWLFVRELGN